MYYLNLYNRCEYVLHARWVLISIGSIMFFQVFPGNNDRYTTVSHKLKYPITARFIRIHPETWQSHISMRAEFYGCKDGKYRKTPQNGY